ncbi:MAG: hypothetical protein P8P41_07555 [Flavobacteriaceae bacterium]|nr:hypothetical protein [Flavobacteriaceae bacterium]
MNKNWVSSFSLSLLLLLMGCSSPTKEVERNYQETKSFVSSKVYDLDKWFQLDSIFNSSVYEFRSNESKVKPEYNSKVDSITTNYNDLTKEFYENYFFNQFDKLESLVSSIDFNDKLSYENFNDFFSKTTQEFYDLNEKITPETRKEISEKIGSVYAQVIENKAEIFNENLKADFEDFKNQMQTTLQNFFN